MLKQSAFGYLDTFLKNCQDNGLYCILDLHGAPKSQNGYEHSGSMEGAKFWTDETAIEATADLWRYVAEYYKESPYRGVIAAYDLLNEPCADVDPEQGTGKEEWKVMDRLYQAIRDTGDQHVITIEGCWNFASFANPKVFGWKNVLYEIHQYNWGNVPQWLFRDYYELSSWGHEYDVPYYVGEFSCFDDAERWKETLDFYAKRGWSWTVWNYKTSSDGWWDNTWGIYTHKQNRQDGSLKVDLRTATLAELLAMCGNVKTENCSLSNTYKYLREYAFTK